jgi:acetate kinase
MNSTILVLNAGSSSLKFSVFLDDEPPRPLLGGQIDGLFTHPRFLARSASAIVGERTWDAGTTLGHAGAIEFLLAWCRDGRMPADRFTAVGHRVVHGGERFDRPAIVDARTLSELEALIPLAPLHQPHNIAAIKAVAARAPQIPQVACFDTAFHRTQPDVAQMFALPRKYTEAGVRRYGFHGLSYEHIASELPHHDPRAAAGSVVVAHLGNGASLCAMRGGRSVATTMGLTALDGLVMGTRPGAIDPGALLYLMDRYGLDARALEQLLYQESGLLGVSGISSDMRALLGSADASAAQAVDLFVYRAGRELGSMAAALGGVDALVFTGGIGEHAPSIRGRICRDAQWLGLEFDEDANDHDGPRISRSGSRVSAWVIAANEELTIARHARRALHHSASAHRSRIYEHH